jgi:hypothetical protein
VLNWRKPECAKMGSEFIPAFVVSVAPGALLRWDPSISDALLLGRSAGGVPCRRRGHAPCASSGGGDVHDVCGSRRLPCHRRRERRPSGAPAGDDGRGHRPGAPGTAVLRAVLCCAELPRVRCAPPRSPSCVLLHRRAAIWSWRYACARRRSPPWPSSSSERPASLRGWMSAA